MAKQFCVGILAVLLASQLFAADVTYDRKTERRFSGAAATYQRQAEYRQAKLNRLVESLDRTCSPSRETLLKNAKGKSLWTAKLVVKHMSRAERLAAK